MRIEGVDKNTIIKLRNSSISTQMKSLESCDWVVLEEEENVVENSISKEIKNGNYSRYWIRPRRLTSSNGQ